MCGRFILQGGWAELHDMFNLIRPEDKGRNVPPRYNIAPTQDVLFIHNRDGDRILNEGRWWLVPWWAKELPKWTLFNARSEDVHKKNSFRDAFKSKRCLIPADGYYEWTKNEEDGKKDPHCITLPDWEPFAFAGLWAHNDNLGVTSCTILTAAAAPEIEHLHHRMPIILKQSEFDTWLDEDTDVETARGVLKHNRGSELVSYRVGREVNSSRAKGAGLAEATE
ncbi:MAG: SOS response-associated peptidase, partial [Pseudomonadota bacterium]